jgi:hypothetical protein
MQRLMSARGGLSGLQHFADVVERGSYTQKLWMRMKRKAAYLPG